MKSTFLLYLVPFLMYSCGKPNNVIVVQGHVKNIPGKKVYLTDAYYWEVVLDSAEYKNDTFSFHLDAKNFEPFVASIWFKNDDGTKDRLVYQNYILSTADSKYGGDAFFLDKGITSISGIREANPTKKTDDLKIVGNKQMDPFFKTQLSDFGWIASKDPTERKKIISRYKNFIAADPYSYYFLGVLYNYRSLYTKEELQEMLSVFDDEAKQSKYHQMFLNYFSQLPKPGFPLLNYTLKNSSNQSTNIIDTSVSINMIIFWASWCGPCRKEIPRLKEIYSTFKNKGINMISVSIDSDTLMWKNALVKEKMPWEQLIADPSLVDNIKNSFNFSSIPLIIFTDNKKIEIQRFTGYEPDSKDEYTPIIAKYIKL